jgi:hypothetical protein
VDGRAFGGMGCAVIVSSVSSVGEEPFETAINSVETASVAMRTGFAVDH